MQLTATTGEATSDGIFNEYAPSASVLVPTVVPLTTTNAPITGFPAESVMRPFIRVADGAAATTAGFFSSRTMLPLEIL